MSEKTSGRILFVSYLLLGLSGGYFIYEISGRNVTADFIRPAVALFLLSASTLLCVKAGKLLTAMIPHFLGCILYFLFAATFLYYRSINSVFTGDDVVAIAQSNPEELFDFLNHYIINTKVMFVSACIAVFYAYLGRILIKTRPAGRVRGKASLIKLIMAMFMTVAAIIICLQLRPVKYYRIMSSELQERIAVFNRLAGEIENSSVHNVSKEEKGELYLLIIGESLSRDSMGVYTGITDNTPYLSALAEQDNTVVFKNAYSSFVNTVPSITASFSDGNLKTGLTFPKGENLISLVNRAGFTTYWISNQVRNGNADTPIGALSSFTDHSFFTTEFVFDGSYSQQPDEILLPEISKTIDQMNMSENRLLIIHIMGNHSPYYNRYPDDYEEIRLEEGSFIGSLINRPPFSENLLQASDYESYLTSVRYNDEIIGKIIDMVKDRRDFRAAVYYSDHGEALLYQSMNDISADHADGPAGRHNIAQFGYAMTRIPFIVSCSDKFIQSYPEKFAAMKHNKDEILTNDTLFDFMLDLMNIKTDAADLTLSPASATYDRGLPDDVMLVGNRAVGDDPDYIAFSNAVSSLGRRLIIRSANAVFKAESSLSKGFTALQIDTLKHNDKLYVQALSEYDKSMLTPAEFIKLLADSTAELFISLPQDASEQDITDIRDGAAAAGFKGKIRIIADNRTQYEFALKSELEAVLNIKGEDIKAGNILQAEAVMIDADILKEDPTEAELFTAYGSELYIRFDDLSVQQKDLAKKLSVFDSYASGFIVGYHNAFDTFFESGQEKK